MFKFLRSMQLNPLMTLAAQVFSLIKFSKQDFCATWATHLNKNDIFPLNKEAGIIVTDEVKRSGDWTCIMWQKWGYVKDSAAPKEFLQAGTVTHRLVRITPTKPEFLDFRTK